MIVDDYRYKIACTLTELGLTVTLGWTCTHFRPI